MGWKNISPFDIIFIGFLNLLFNCIHLSVSLFEKKVLKTCLGALNEMGWMKFIQPDPDGAAAVSVLWKGFLFLSPVSVVLLWLWKKNLWNYWAKTLWKQLPAVWAHCFPIIAPKMHAKMCVFVCIFASLNRCPCPFKLATIYNNSERKPWITWTLNFLFRLIEHLWI